MSPQVGRSRWGATAKAVAGVLTAAAAVMVLAASAANGAGAEGPGRRIEVSMRDGNLDARIQGVALSEALAALGRAAQARVTILHADTAAPVSLRSDGLSLEEALQRLLRGQSYVLVYRDDAPPGRLAEIIVLGTRRGPGDEIVTLAEAAGTETAGTSIVAAAAAGTLRVEHPADATRGFQSPTRQRPLPIGEAAPASGQDRPRPGGGAVTLALAHADENLRLAALAQVQDGTEAPPMRMLTRMAREDASPTIRMQALEILADQSPARARGPLRQALWDPNPEVQHRAFELLGRLGPESSAQDASAGAPAAARTAPRYVAPPIPQQGP